MKQNFSLINQINNNFDSLEKIDECIQIALGPTGKNGIILNQKGELKFLTNGSLIMKSLEFSEKSDNILLKLLEQSSIKTHLISGDGSTLTILLACDLLKNSLNFLTTGYNSIFLSNGLKKIAHFCLEKVLEFSQPIDSFKKLIGILKTSLGKKIPEELKTLLFQAIEKISRDGLILVEENVSQINEVDIVQGIELDKGFASSYFVTDLKNFEVCYEKPYLLITSDTISSLNQIKDVIDYTKSINRALIIIAEDITKEIISTLVLNNIQKKLKIAVIKYNSIKFLKTGILEDLAILTHSNYFCSDFKIKQSQKYFLPNDLGQAEKVIIKKEKSTFLISKYSKLIAKRRINELNRELVTSETEHEKMICKTRIARLSGNIIKIKIGVSNRYQIEEERQKLESAIHNLRSSLEEGVVPGGGIFYELLSEELKTWASFNLVGDELFASQLVRTSFSRPFTQLCKNSNLNPYKIREKLKNSKYPYCFDFLKKTIVHSFEDGLLDSSKCVRGILWNSLTIISTILTSE